jgi:hypothetical protein
MQIYIPSPLMSAAYRPRSGNSGNSSDMTGERIGEEEVQMQKSAS